MKQLILVSPKSEHILASINDNATELEINLFCAFLENVLLSIYNHPYSIFYGIDNIKLFYSDGDKRKDIKIQPRTKFKGIKEFKT